MVLRVLGSSDLDYLSGDHHLGLSRAPKIKTFDWNLKKFISLPFHYLHLPLYISKMVYKVAGKHYHTTVCF